MTNFAVTAQAYLEHGIALYQQGRYAEATSYLQQALHLQPDNPDVHTWLANAFVYQQRLEEGLQHYRLALRLNPDIFGAHYVLAVALRDRGQCTEAETHFRHALRLNPNHAETHHGLAITLMNQGRLQEAEWSFRQALRLDPQRAEFHFNLGTLLERQRQPALAISSYRLASLLNPRFPEAFNNLGNALKLEGKLDEAVASCRQALRLRPEFAEAHHNLGAALADQKQFAEAATSFEHALRLKPDAAETHNNLGCALQMLGRMEDAANYFRHALKLSPNFAEAHFHLGFCLARQGQFDDALIQYDLALRIQPDYQDVHWQRCQLLLLRGDFEHGWPAYESRWTQPGFSSVKYSQPRWDGSPLNGRTIVVTAEQGLGDMLQFVRYAALLKNGGGTVVVECHTPLEALAASVCGVDGIVPLGSPLPHFDVHAPLLSLPGIFRTNLATIPATVPYIHADAARIERWRQDLSDVRRLASGVHCNAAHQTPDSRQLLVGVAWQGNPKHAFDAQRSLPLVNFEPLARLDGVELLSLQVGPGAEQLAELQGRFHITDLGSRFDPASLADAAAVLMNVDMLITADTALAHLAGALAVPVWVAIPFVPDWRWQVNREDSPWYPTMRLFRQERAGDWNGVIARMARAIPSIAAAPISRRARV